MTDVMTSRVIRPTAFLIMVTIAAFAIRADGADGLKVMVRRPVAGVLLDDSVLVVANRASGSLSAIDLKRSEVVGETTVGASLVDVERIDADRLLVIDHSNHQLLTCRFNQNGFETLAKRTVAPYPIDATVCSGGTWFAVTSLWSRKLAVGPIESHDGPIASVDLPFPPRCVLLVEESQRIIVSDAFGGRIAVIRYEIESNVIAPSKLVLESVREIDGHNIRHLTLTTSGDERQLRLSQMSGSRLAQPLQDEVHWGNYLSSSIRSLSMASILDPNSRLSKGSRTLTIGDVQNGSADPGSFIHDERGRLLIAISGADQIAVFDRFGNAIDRIAVGPHPTRLIPVGESQFVSINQFGDNISIINASSDDDVFLVTGTLSLGPQPSMSERERGEALFHSAALSHDGWMSCHSCHTDGHTCGLAFDTLGDGGVGEAKRVLSLRGIRGTEPLAWNGSLDFDSQIRKSVLHTMHGRAITDDQVASLVAYLESLQPLPRRSELKLGPTSTMAVARGERLFTSIGCENCHTGESKTSPKTYDVGIHDSIGNQKFNPPSLRGVVHRDSFLHDGRAKNLRDLLIIHRHPKPLNLTDQQVDDLIQYLKSL